MGGSQIAIFARKLAGAFLLFAVGASASGCATDPAPTPLPTIPLLQAAEQGNVPEVQSNLVYHTKGRITDKDASGRTALSLASRGGCDGAVSPLLAAGSDVNTTDHLGQTPLHGAAAYEAPETVRLLLAAGAKVDAKDSKGDTPLHLAAARRNNEAVVKLLLDRGADVNARNKDGQTPLQVAEACGNEGAAAGGPREGLSPLKPSLASPLLAGPRRLARLRARGHHVKWFCSPWCGAFQVGTRLLC